MRMPSPLYATVLVALLAACGTSGTTATGTPNAADTTADGAGKDGGATDTAKADGVADVAADTGAKPDATKDVGKTDVQVAAADDKIEGATPLAVGVTAEGDLDPTGDVDWYKFEGKKGQLVTVGVASNQTLKGTVQDGTMIDTILTLYGPDKQPYALNDDGNSTGNNDSVIRTILPADGTYYVELQECQTWLPEHPNTGSTCNGDAEKADTYYWIYVDVADPATNKTAISDKEPNDTIATAVPLVYQLNPKSTTKGSYYADVIFGTFASVTDVDVYKFTVPANAPVSKGRATVFFDADKEGPNGNGSTSGPGIAWLASDVSPTVVIAQVDMAKGTLSVPLAFGSTFYLYVQHGPEKGGKNDFYVYQHYVGGAGELEANEAGNDLFSTAETAKVNKGTSGIAYFYVSGDLIGGAKDVDHWQFAVPANASSTTLSVLCWAGAHGSGLRGIKATLLDATGAPVANVKGTEKDGLFSATGIAVKGGAKLIAKITADSQDDKVMSSFYDCEFVFVPPTAP